jgi:antitoxin VapB
MPLSIKNPDVERLVSDTIALTGESKTEAIRAALEARLTALSFRVAGVDRAARLKRFLETEAWPQVPEGELGRRWSRAEEDALLGYGEDGA